MRERPEDEAAPRDDETLRALVAKLSRPHPSGGVVIERAAILASGARSSEILRWVTEHGGEAEELAPSAGTGGLHGERMQSTAGAKQVLRYVVPASAVARPSAEPPAH